MRRNFDRQFKMAAVKLVKEDEYAVSEVAKELNIHYNSLYRWIREYEEFGESAFPGKGFALYNYQNEIKKLQRENESLREELELLKKFRAFLKPKST
jgi:transposase